MKPSPRRQIIVDVDNRLRLGAKIRAFVNGWNDRCHPFVWPTTAEDILKKANRQPTSNTGH